MDEQFINVLIALTFLFFYLMIFIKIGIIYIKYSKTAQEESVFEKLRYSIKKFLSTTVISDEGAGIAALIAIPFIVLPVIIIGLLIGNILTLSILKFMCILLGIIFIGLTVFVLVNTMRNFKRDKLKTKIEINWNWILSLFVLLIFLSAYSSKYN